MNYAAEIKSAVTMQNVCEMYGIEVNRMGFACCPLHNEKTGSMKVYPGDRGYHCFGCHSGGSVIDFVMAYQGVTFQDAERVLNDAFHLGLPIDGELSADQCREARKKAAERKREQQRRQREHTRLQTAYDKALTAWVDMDKAIREKAPQSNSDSLDDAWVYAIKNIGRASYELDLAEMALTEFERRR